ncbi:MAG: substrate-binding domain-containing protein, partial [Verrucomicrobiota bacterium]
EPMHLIPRLGLEFLSHLRTWLPQMDLRYHGVTFDGSRKPRSAWDRLVELEQPDQMLVMEGSLDLAKWAAAGRVPTVFLGGNPADTGIPTVGVHAGEAIADMLTELLAMGHERICLLMLGRNPDFVAGMRNLFRRVFDEAGKTFVPTYHVPAVVASDPEVVWSVMAQLVATRVPTALIFFMWDEFLAAQCFLAAKGLRIPTDVSVVLLGGGESNLWYRPKLTYFAYPSERAAELAAHWIEDGPPTGKSTVSLPLKLVRGESVAPPPQK